MWYPRLNRENIFAAGQLIAERHPVTTTPTLTANTTMFQNGSYGFTIFGGASGATYSVDIRTADGFENHLSGVAPGTGGVFGFRVAFAAGQRNWVSVRKESATGEAYSNVVAPEL